MANSFEALEEYLNAYFSQLSLDLQKSLANKTRSKNKNTRLGASIKPFYKFTGAFITAGIRLNEYYYWVDGGRKPGNVAESVDLKDWAKRKGIDPREKIEAAREAYRDKHVKVKRVAKLKPLSYTQAAKSFEYIVKRKLTKKGYEGNNFYSDIVTRDRIAKLEKNIAVLFQKEMQFQLTEFNK